jgi:hypothetical protein
MVVKRRQNGKGDGIPLWKTTEVDVLSQSTCHGDIVRGFGNGRMGIWLAY